MSEGGITGFGPMQKYEDDSDDDSPVVRMKTVSSTQASFSVKLTLAFVGVAAVLALLITVVAISLGAASVQRASLLATPATPSTPTTTTPPAPLDDSSNCGAGVWKRIAYLNMSDPTQQCPTGWRGYSTPVRSCGRPVTARSTCAPVYFSTNGMQYSRVCGRLTGYQKGSPDGFKSTNFDKTLDGIYVDGVSMTHGNPRTHIWSFAVGLYTSENQNANNCPSEGGRQQPDFVGGNFFCNSGDHDPQFEQHRFYDQDPLWSGKDCPNTTGCPFNSPPWFETKLPRSTMDDIEVRICGDQSTGDEDSPIQLLELYVQ